MYAFFDRVFPFVDRKKAIPTLGNIIPLINSVFSIASEFLMPSMKGMLFYITYLSYVTSLFACL